MIPDLDRALERNKELHQASTRMQRALASAKLTFSALVSAPWLVSMLFREPSAREGAAWIAVAIAGRYVASFVVDRTLGARAIARLNAKYPELKI